MKAVAVIFLLIAAPCVVRAQHAPSSPERGAKLGNAYSIGDVETINTTNGNLIFNFPLGSLPAGRGDVSGGVSLVYNSKIWDMKSEKLEDFRGSPYPPFYDRTLITPAPTGGWQLNAGGISIEYEDRRNEYLPNWPSCPNGMGDDIGLAMTYIHKVRIVLPDGSKHEMVPNGYSDHPYNEDGFYRVRWDGWLENCGGTPTRTGHAMVYRSIDGTFLRLEYSYDSDDIPSNNTWTLYFPDGKKFTPDGKLYDKNGNYVTMAYNGITDQLGRAVTISEATNGDTLVTSEGVGGEDIVWTIKWKYIAISKTYASCDGQRCPNAYDYRSNLTGVLRVVHKIVQPAELGGEYVFEYNAPDSPGSGQSDGWGEISAVTLPTGARIEYDYVMDGDDGGTFVETPAILKNYPTTKTVKYDLEYDGQTIENGGIETWTYSIENGQAVVTGPDGGMTTTQFVWGEGSELPWDQGLTYSMTGPNGARVEKIWKKNIPSLCGTVACRDEIGINTYVDMEFTSVKNAGGTYTLTTIKDFAYDKNGNVTEVKEYDWMPYGDVPRTSGFPTGLPSGASSYLKRVTKTQYYNNTPDAVSTDYSDTDSYHAASSPRLLQLPKSTEIQDASGTPKSRSEMVYDNTSYSTNTLGGNLTQTKAWDSTKGAYSDPLTSSNWIVTSATYDSTYGFPLTTTDANGVVTTLTYGCIDGATGCSAQLQNLYPTKTEAASNYSTLKRTSTSQYDFYTGAVTESKDVDNNVKVVTEYDDLGRPVKVRNAHGTALESWTQTTYDDAERRIIVKADLETLGDAKKVAIQHFDQLGRVRLARTLEDAATESATNEQHGIKVQTRYKIASGFTYRLQSNPYRAATSAAASSEEMMGWTMSQTRNDGQYAETQTFAGAGLPSTFGGSNSSSTGIVKTSTDANVATVEDQAGKKRRSITNALGQLIRVDEPDANNNLGSVGSPNQPTYYSYNALGKMIHVEQGLQHRYFVHDSLGRLLRVRQPEQQVNTALNTSGNPDNNNWTIGFSYDNNGNTLTSRDANNVVITTSYDALNRPLARSYSDSTPPVTYGYDSSQVPFSKGRLTSLSSSVSETRYTEYDVAGRLVSSEQATDGQVYPSSYKYNRAGMLIEQTYPSGRVVQNVLDNNGDISIIRSRKNENFGYWNYAQSFEYTPSGVIKHLRLGNGLWESAVMNSRNQVLELRMGNSPTNGSRMHLTFDYGEFDPNGNFDTTKNAGNIARQTINFSGLANPFVQSYKYDSLDRITEAKETVNGGQIWIQQFGYDRYGNRTSHSETVLGQAKPINETTLPSIDAYTNKFSNTTNYEFDAVGNLIRDAEGRQFIFNGDNKQIEVQDVQDATVGEYVYDGLGKRIKKITASETIVFVYDGLGKLIEEYSTAGPPQNPRVNYTATDPLGSPRVLTNENGAIISRRDFMPFGEEIEADTTYRTTNLKYGIADNVRQRFTGYERDEETDLDFAEARYYFNNHGRFTAVDPLLASGKSSDPQTFNRYAYVMNRPLVLTDSTGLQAGQEKDVVKVETQLSKKAPSIYNVRVTSNGKDVRDDLYIGDKFTITYTARVNRADEGQDLTKVGRIEGVDYSRNTGFKDGKPTGAEAVDREGRDSFSDLDGAKATTDQVVDKVGNKKDETEVTFSQTFEITGRKDGSPGGSNAINFQIVVTDPRAPLTENRNNSNQDARGTQPPNPAIFTTRPFVKRSDGTQDGGDPRKGVTSDPYKAVGYRNRRRPENE